MRLTEIVAVGLQVAGTVAQLGPRRSLPWLQKDSSLRLHKRDAPDPSDLYPAHTLSVPVDHFHNSSLYEPHSSETFPLRYWFDTTYYKPGGPVIVLSAGETSGTGRLPYLQKGIVAQLSKVTGGIGVILEHRYYGESFPVPDLSTENLRFLTTEQALADTAYFAEHVQFPGIEEKVNPPYKPWIAYGGSYAGGFVAILRVLYPDTFWGAIASSGVTAAIYDYWEYHEPIRKYGPKDCIANAVDFVKVIDHVLLGSDEPAKQELKKIFGMSGIEHSGDFATVLAYGVWGWQGRNWDPAINDGSFAEYCGNVTADSILYPDTASLKPAVAKLASSADVSPKIVTPLLNLIGYTQISTLAPCASSERTQEQCFGTYNSTYYAQDSLDDDWRAWPYQYCTQWGYIQTGSGVPEHIPPLVSRTLDLEYLTIVCREAFGITGPPDVDAINKYGGYEIAAERLAFVDGEADPWRPVTPGADGAPWRENTLERPWWKIPGGVHHWDENGVFKNETGPGVPSKDVRWSQEYEAKFVKEWIWEWKGCCKKEGWC
ncbi:hypothetical protein P152DRAFT_452514 [Eremomyces bilateralis CBS 781.70]|uniref:Extracelular serine carboxypeptidase n=1 Tax=Eremomyces bilateralis CBS 781.70 TaxID=1392243 RepID=A0A6G1FT66_9PEZI|nr:uncharacterized protein P152DRAFT_452514 [Eremomyces bilateralis CBS 781.70]KAF1808861.1 hypothetical protein P152DRAFT_452514 [Eremomyces bilateralis CBS 781.70]